MVDASLRATILGALRQMTLDLGIPVVYITHDLTTAYQVAENIVVLYRGAVVEAGDVELVVKRPSTRTRSSSSRRSRCPASSARGRRRRAGPAGAPPGREDAGCSFEDRCPSAMPVCRVAAPPLYRTGTPPGRLVLPLPGRARAAGARDGDGLRRASGRAGPGPVGARRCRRARSVLVTGSAGRIGRAVSAELRARGHRVRGFDRVPSPGLADSVVGDLARPADLAQRDGRGRDRGPPGRDAGRGRLPDEPPAEQRRRALPRARGGPPRRVSPASSSRAAVSSTAATRAPPDRRSTTPTSPRNWYALTKVLLEAAGQRLRARARPLRGRDPVRLVPA